MGSVELRDAVDSYLFTCVHASGGLRGCLRGWGDLGLSSSAEVGYIEQEREI